MKLLLAEDKDKTGTYLQRRLGETGFNVDRVLSGTKETLKKPAFYEMVGL